MFRFIKHLVTILTFAALIATNVLTVTNAAFNTALSGFMGTYLGVRTLANTMQTKLASKDAIIKKQKTLANNRKLATRRFGTRLTARTKRVAAKSIAAIPGEAIPFLGVAVLVADTGYELYAACETVKDLDQLYTDLDMNDEIPEDTLHSVCEPKLPSAEEVWQGVIAKSGEWLDHATGAM